MNKLKLILAASIAATALTLSCSGDDGGDSGSGSVTETYTLENKTDEQFTYTGVEEDDEYCRNGVLEEREYSRTVYYSIDNKVLTWGSAWSYDGDTIQFKGTTDELIGTWTRTKDKATSCKLRTDHDGDSWISCKEDYDITKAVFTATSVEITRDECGTDWVKNGESYKGWITKVIDCDAVEYSKGSEKITYRETRTTEVANYKGKSCSYSRPTKAQKQDACKKAQNESDYWDILDRLGENYYKCLKNLLPPEFMDDDDYDDYGKAAAKPQVKARITPLLKKN